MLHDQGSNILLLLALCSLTIAAIALVVGVFDMWRYRKPRGRSGK